MYVLTIRKSCRVLETLQGLQMAYGFIIDYSYKTIIKIYGFDPLEIAVISDYVRIRREVIING